MLRAGIACRAHGWRFDHAAFVASFRSSKTRAFLSHLRESQCFEVFINDRLSMAAEGMASFDAFETKVGVGPPGRPLGQHLMEFSAILLYPRLSLPHSR